MTRDFDAFGTLDIAIYATLRRCRHPDVLELSTFYHPELTVDGIAEHNARVFIRHFDGRKIYAIKELHAASGFDLRTSKEAVEQILESYQASRDYQIAAAGRALLENQIRYASELLARVLHRDAVMGGEDW
jgi:hypothetical protein